MGESYFQKLVELLRQADDPKLNRSIYWYVRGYLFGKQKKEKAPDGRPSDQSARENIQEQDSTDYGGCQEGGGSDE